MSCEVFPETIGDPSKDKCEVISIGPESWRVKTIHRNGYSSTTAFNFDNLVRIIKDKSSRGNCYFLVRDLSNRVIDGLLR